MKEWQHKRIILQVVNCVRTYNNFRKQKTNDRKTYEIIVERIYFNMMDFRLEGYLDGELVYENELQKINRLQWENKKLKIQN